VVADRMNSCAASTYYASICPCDLCAQKRELDQLQNDDADMDYSVSLDDYPESFASSSSCPPPSTSMSTGVTSDCGWPSETHQDFNEQVSGMLAGSESLAPWSDSAGLQNRIYGPEDGYAYPPLSSLDPTSSDTWHVLGDQHWKDSSYIASGDALVQKTNEHALCSPPQVPPEQHAMNDFDKGFNSLQTTTPALEHDVSWLANWAIRYPNMYPEMEKLKSLESLSGMSGADIVAWLRERFDNQTKPKADPIVTTTEQTPRSQRAPRYKPKCLKSRRRFRHIPEKPNTTKIFECTRRCGESFRKKGDWKRHELYNIEEWRCHICNFAPSRKDKLPKHLQECHDYYDPRKKSHCRQLLHASARPCGFCGARFRDWSTWLNHVAAHFEGHISGGPWTITRWSRDIAQDFGWDENDDDDSDDNGDWDDDDDQDNRDNNEDEGGPDSSDNRAQGPDDQPTKGKGASSGSGSKGSPRTSRSSKSQSTGTYKAMSCDSGMEMPGLLYNATQAAELASANFSELLVACVMIGHVSKAIDAMLRSIAAIQAADQMSAQGFYKYKELPQKRLQFGDCDLTIRKTGGKVNGKAQATLFNGVRAHAMLDTVVEPTIGILCMAGDDAPQVSHMEQIDLAQSTAYPKIATQEANTANHEYARSTSTAEWFFQSAPCNSWRQTATSLWLQSKPGYGKSIVASTVIENAKIHFSQPNSSDGPMARYYFFKDPKKQNTHARLLSFLAQTKGEPEIHKCLTALARLTFLNQEYGRLKPGIGNLGMALVGRFVEHHIRSTLQPLHEARMGSIDDYLKSLVDTSGSVRQNSGTNAMLQMLSEVFKNDPGASLIFDALDDWLVGYLLRNLNQGFSKEARGSRHSLYCNRNCSMGTSRDQRMYSAKSKGLNDILPNHKGVETDLILKTMHWLMQSRWTSDIAQSPTRPNILSQLGRSCVRANAINGVLAVNEPFGQHWNFSPDHIRSGTPEHYSANNFIKCSTLDATMPVDIWSVGVVFGQYGWWIALDWTGDIPRELSNPQPEKGLPCTPLPRASFRRHYFANKIPEKEDGGTRDSGSDGVTALPNPGYPTSLTYGGHRSTIKALDGYRGGSAAGVKRPRAQLVGGKCLTCRHRKAKWGIDTVPLKNPPRTGEFMSDSKSHGIWDAVRATSAAPSYFPMARIEGDKSSSGSLGDIDRTKPPVVKAFQPPSCYAQTYCETIATNGDMRTTLCYWERIQREQYPWNSMVSQQTQRKVDKLADRIDKLVDRIGELVDRIDGLVNRIDKSVNGNEMTLIRIGKLVNRIYQPMKQRQSNVFKTSSFKKVQQEGLLCNRITNTMAWDHIVAIFSLRHSPHMQPLNPLGLSELLSEPRLDKGLREARDVDASVPRNTEMGIVDNTSDEASRGDTREGEIPILSSGAVAARPRTASFDTIRKVYGLEDRARLARFKMERFLNEPEDDYWWEAFWERSKKSHAPEDDLWVFNDLNVEMSTPRNRLPSDEPSYRMAGATSTLAIPCASRRGRKKTNVCGVRQTSPVDGQTPLWRAAEGGHEGVAKLLLG
jgi:hypothetical protein